MGEFRPLSRCLAQAYPGALTFFCPGCEAPHTVQIGEGPGPRWGFNNDLERPTFTPSVLVTWTQWEPPATAPEIAAKIELGLIVQTEVAKACHSFITDGRIQYLGDCTHPLAGQTLDLPNWEEAWANWWS